MDRPKYFTPAEVAAHNTAEDLWVSFLGKVCDLTPLMNRYKGEQPNLIQKRPNLRTGTKGLMTEM